MIMALIMLATWQYTGSNQYQEPFKKTVEAAYTNSEIKQAVDVTVDKATKKYPRLAAVGPVVYSIGVRRQAQITTTKLSLVPGTVTTYRYENKSGSITITFSF